MKSLRLVSIIFFCWFGFIHLLFYFGSTLFVDNQSLVFLDRISYWDSTHYLLIGQYGYFQSAEYAFFPLYPLLIRTVAMLLGNYVIAGLLINYISTFLGVYFFYKLVTLEKGKSVALYSIIFLLFFPTSFFFLIVYSEALFFLFSVLCFYFLKKEQYFLAALFSGFATATRPFGIAVAIALFSILFLTRRYRKALWSYQKLLSFGLLSVSGICGYMIFLYFQTGTIFSFLSAQSNWNRSIGMPWDGVILNILNIVSANNIFVDNLNTVWEFIFTVFGLGLVFRTFRFLPLQYGIYGLVSLLLPLTTSSLMSIPRFLLPLFPLFIVLSLIKKKSILITYAFVSIILLCYFSVLFINGYWVS